MNEIECVSVIIPTWNRSELLLRAIRSVLSQTYPLLEVLVCDDGSTDNTEQVVQLIGDSRVRWLPGKRAGRPAVPRNRGICASKGDWVAFLDDDDMWLPRKLELQLELLKRTGCYASCTQAVVGENDLYNLGWCEPILSFKDLLGGNRVICSSVVVHRRLLNRVGGFPETAQLKSIEDYALWLRVATVTNFSFIFEPLAVYSDSPQTSLRAACVDPWFQKRLVLSDFIFWGAKRRIAIGFLWAAMRGYSKALLVSARRHCRESLSLEKRHA